MAPDLSELFGSPATASLRGLLPRRGDEAPPPGTGSAAVPADPAPVDIPGPVDVAASVDVPAPRRPGTPARARSASGTGTTANRRWGVVRVASRDHVELLVLLALRHGPADGRGVITRLRERSRGQLVAPERTVHATLHRLARNRLLVRRPDPDSGRHRYALTEAGDRAARARQREWQALTRCMDAVAGTDADW